MLLRPILLVAAACYHAVYKLHHRVCLRPGKPLEHAQLIVVGSFLAGGAGKTPFTAWLAQFLLENSRSVANGIAGKDCAATRDDAGKECAAPQIAILCHSKAKDEAEMLRQQFAGTPQVCVIATSNRYKTAHEIDRDYDYIVCDDGFEDTRLAGAKTIRLDWGKPPAHLRELLPAGKNRSLLQDHDMQGNARTALVLQCGADVAVHKTAPAFETAPTCETAPTHKTVRARTLADITFSIARIKNAAGIAFDPQQHADAVAACGIGNPERFREDLTAFGISPAGFVARPDHDRRFEQTINMLISRKVPVIVTEKDAARLPRDLCAHSGIYTAYQQVSVSKAAQEKILQTLFPSVI